MTNSNRLSFPLALLLLATTTSCVQVLGIDDTTLQNTGPTCPLPGTDFAPPVSKGDTIPEEVACYGHSTPPDQSSIPPTITINVTADSAINTAIKLPKVRVRACPSVLDQACSGAIEGTTSTDGTVPLTVTTSAGFGGVKGFSGYLLIEAAGYHPLVWFFPTPLVGDYPLEAQLLESSAWETLVKGQRPSCSNRADRGDFVSLVVGCPVGDPVSQAPAKDVTFRISSADQDSSPLLFTSQFAPDTGTDQSGYIAQFNLPAGPAALTVYDETTGAALGESFNFFFLDGHSSTFLLFPR